MYLGNQIKYIKYQVTWHKSIFNKNMLNRFIQYIYKWNPFSHWISVSTKILICNEFLEKIEVIFWVISLRV